MVSIFRHLNIPSTARRIWSGLLFRPGCRSPVSGSMFQPNLVAITP
jgi:hypothetical protein